MIWYWTELLQNVSTVSREMLGIATKRLDLFFIYRGVQDKATNFDYEVI